MGTLCVAMLVAASMCACTDLGNLSSGGPEGGDAPSGDSPNETGGDGTTDAGGDGADSATDAGDAGKDGAPDVYDPSLLAYWRIDEGEGGVTHDSTGHPNDGVLVGKPTWFPNSYDNSPALLFDGMTNEYVDFGNPGDLQLVGSMTISAWFNVVTFVDGGPDMPIVSKRSPGDRGWELYVSDQEVAFDVATSMTSYTALYGATTLAPGTWYHAVGVYDATVPRLDVYVNGVATGSLFADAGVPPAQHDSSNRIDLGNSSGCVVSGDAGCPGGQLFHGIIDEVRVYGAALSPTEVQAIP